MTTCCIALGGNTGDVAAAFEQALQCLADDGHHVVAVSQNQVTAAMGADAGNDFLNAAAVVETSLDAVSFLRHLHEIEHQLGRRRAVHWGPRSIDLDLLFFGQQVLNTDEIRVPHPCLWFRHFVLKPLQEIAAEWQHPVLDDTVAGLANRLNQRPLRLEVVAGGLIERCVAAIQADPNSPFNGSYLQFASVPGGSPVSQANFARLIDTSDVDQGRIGGRCIPVTLDSGDSLTGNVAQLGQFLKDFTAAAIG